MQFLLIVSCHDFVVLFKVFGVLEIRITGIHGGGNACKIQHLSLSGHKKVKDYDEQIMAMFLVENDEYASAFKQRKQEGETPWNACETTREVKVFVWGLNDKDQLGGFKGSKVMWSFELVSSISILFSLF